MEFIWLNGAIVKSKDAKISVVSHSLHYGSAVFEGIRAYETEKGPAVFRLHEHIERLFDSAKTMGLVIPYSKQVIEKAVLKTIAVNKLHECYIRPIVFYGKGQMTLFPDGAEVNVAIAVWPWPPYLGDHKAHSICVSPYIRFHPKSVVHGAKIAGMYATSVIATLDARARGFNECIMLDHEGNVAEGPGENIFMIKKGKLYTPKSASILNGLTRDSILKIARENKIPSFEKKISLPELLSADEAFFSGTAVEIASIGKVNNKKIGNGKVGPITNHLRNSYFSVVHGKDKRYKKWLTLCQSK